MIETDLLIQSFSEKTENTQLFLYKRLNSDNVNNLTLFTMASSFLRIFENDLVRLLKLI